MAALKRVWLPSPNCSSRAGASVRLIVIHTAEGARTYQDLGAFFARSSTQASSHVGADDTLGTVGEYVHAGDKAWTVASYNPVSVNCELCGFAAWTTDTWRHEHENMLRNCAAWIAEESRRYGIPIRKLTPAEAQGSGRGVCAHADLGAAGGGHTDPGAGFPWDHVLEMARAGPPASKPPPPPPGTGEATAAVTCHLDRKANIWAVRGTPSKTAHLDTKDVWETAEVAVNRKTGEWRIHEKGRRR